MNRVRKLLVAAMASATYVAAPLVAFASPPAQKAALTEDAARGIAMKAVPAGVVQSAELETEHGLRVWSFDIKDAKSRVVEVQVDAKTGAIVSRKFESVQDQRKEAKADQLLKR